MRTRIALAVIAPWVVAGFAFGAFSIDWSTIDGGGNTSTGGGFELTGTLGQPDAGTLSGGTYALTGGFWGAATSNACASFVGADFDKDCDVDIADLNILKACSTRAQLPYNPAALPPGCVLAPDGSGHIAADFDGDGDVDSNDFGIFQKCYSGSGHLPPQNCGN